VAKDFNNSVFYFGVYNNDALFQGKGVENEQEHAQNIGHGIHADLRYCFGNYVMDASGCHCRSEPPRAMVLSA